MRTALGIAVMLLSAGLCAQQIEIVDTGMAASIEKSLREALANAPPPLDISGPTKPTFNRDAKGRMLTVNALDESTGTMRTMFFRGNAAGIVTAIRLDGGSWVDVSKLDFSQPETMNALNVALRTARPMAKCTAPPIDGQFGASPAAQHGVSPKCDDGSPGYDDPGDPQGNSPPPPPPDPRQACRDERDRQLSQCDAALAAGSSACAWVARLGWQAAAICQSEYFAIWAACRIMAPNCE